MKNTHYEHLGRRMREYHRTHQWRLSEGGLFIPHAYSNVGPESLSYWDDVGFILNGRRIIVRWQHPRHVYADAIATMAWKEAGDDPHEDWVRESGTKNYKMVGKSARRKKQSGYTIGSAPEAQLQYYTKLQQIEDRMTREGIALEVRPSWKWTRLRWAMGVELVAPLEVRNEKELAQVACLARGLILQKTTLGQEFPGFVYDRASWLNEQAALSSCSDGH
ncbi:hypothetical protein [Simplicispira hankyongi]|nr:hypothetical protein [Simplicispira hankyongi]